MTATARRAPRARRLEETAFAVWCADGEAAEALRRDRLDGHLAFVEAHHERYLVAGPLRRDAEARLAGSLFVILAETEAEAREFMSGDPYVSAGVYQSMVYRRLTPAAGRWMGGVIWEDADDIRARAAGGP
jgi:hypothetical protein